MPDRQMVPDRLPQGRRIVRLPGAASGNRTVRPYLSQGSLAQSTGNYCRGGAFNSKLLSDAIPSPSCRPSMSKERFDWLKTIASEVIATPGTRDPT
jgi:hypothetical protein